MGLLPSLGPALVLTISERHGDVLLAFISSNVSGPTGRDELTIPADHPGFSDTGLKVSSRIRLSRMTTLAMPLVKRRIKVLPLALQAGCQQALERVICGYSSAFTCWLAKNASVQRP